MRLSSPRASAPKLFVTLRLCAAFCSWFSVSAQTASAADGLQDDGRLPSKLACVESSSRGQEERDAGRLIASRQEFRICAASSCPDVVRQACADWLVEVEGRLPAITLVVTESDGTDVVADEILIDDKSMPELVEGRLVTLDPGRHEASVVVGKKQETVVFVLREGETARQIRVNLPAEPVIEEPPLGTSFPWVPVFTVAGAGLLGSSIGLGLWVKSDRDSCSPHCTDEEASSLRTRLVAAELLLGASVVSFGMATALYLTKPDPPKETAAKGLRFSPIVSKAGAFALVEGQF